MLKVISTCKPQLGGTLTRTQLQKKLSVLHNPINSDLDLGHWNITTLLLGMLQCSDDFDFDTAETLYNRHLGDRRKCQLSQNNVSALNLTGNLCSEFYDHDWLQTCRYKTRVLWRLFAEVREKSVLWFWNYWHFL